MTIEGAPENSSTLTQLFGGKKFIVPQYQRNYAWTKENWKDFWNDITEGLETGTPHYWGTITLQLASKDDIWDENTGSYLRQYEVVDGQQRLTTFVLFLLALCRSGQKGLEQRYVKTGNIHRLRLGPLNNEALKALVDDTSFPGDLQTNRRLRDAYEYFVKQVEAFGRPGELSKYIQGSTFCLEFKVADEMLAISAFESLNDRGRPLSLLDKAKSFLMFNAVRHLDEEVSESVKETFGAIFRNYDHIEEIAEQEAVEYIRNPRYRFSEDELLRLFYHYMGRYAIKKYELSDDMAYDYSLTTEKTFDGFLKESCFLMQDGDLKTYVSDCLSSFRRLVEGFREAMEAARSPGGLRKLLCFLGVNASVYPLLLSAQAEGLGEDLLNCLEVLDLRVYKVRGTDPRADLYRKVISRIKIDQDPVKASEGIRKFIKQFMGDGEFRQYLRGGIDDRRQAVKYILWHHQKEFNPDFNDWDYELYRDVEVEHVFPKAERITLPGFGFENEEEYLAMRGHFGNLTLIEGSLNKRAQNRSPNEKAAIYQESNIPGTEHLGFDIENNGFSKDEVDERTGQIADFALNRWPIPRND